MLFSGLNPVNLVKSAIWRTAFAMRETGQALERLGCTMQGIYSHEEISGWIETVGPMCMGLIFMFPRCSTVNRHVSVASVKFDAPQIANSFVAPSGLVLGKVALGEGCSVWYNATVRGAVRSGTTSVAYI